MRIKQLLRYSLPIFTLILGLCPRSLRAEGLETHVILHTSSGDMQFVLWPTVAPITVLNFIKLSQEGFYDGTSFHRIVRGFIAQGGDPLSRTDSINVGTGGPGYCIPAEFSDKRHQRGTLSMARRATSADSAGSQFFICLNDAPSLDGHYAAFGELVRGWEVLDKLGSAPVTYSAQCVPERPLERILVSKVTVSILKPLSPEVLENSPETPQGASSQPANSNSPTTSDRQQQPAATSPVSQSPAPASQAPAPASQAPAPASQAPAPTTESTPPTAPQPSVSEPRAETSPSTSSPGESGGSAGSDLPKKPSSQAQSIKSQEPAPAKLKIQEPSKSADASDSNQMLDSSKIDIAKKSAPTRDSSSGTPTDKSAEANGDRSDKSPSTQSDSPQSDNGKSSGEAKGAEEETWDRQGSERSQMVQSKTGKTYH